MSLFSFRRSTPADRPSQEKIDRSFQELASATPELGGTGPRDWTPAEDTSGFEAPDPILTPVSRRVKLGWVLLAISLVGFVSTGLALPQFASVAAGFCLVLLGISLWLLLFRPDSSQ